MSDDVLEQVAALLVRVPVDESGRPRADRLDVETLRVIAGCPGPPAGVTDDRSAG